MEKGLQPPFHYLCVMSISPSTELILQISTVNMFRNESQATYQNFTTIQRLTNPGSYFYWDGFGFLWEKKKLRCKGYFSQVRHVFIIPNGDNVQKCVSNLVLKFHDDPTVNDFEIALFPRQVWWYAGKDRVFRGGEGKTKLKERAGIGSIVKNWPKMSLFIAMILTTYY